MRRAGVGADPPVGVGGQVVYLELVDASEVLAAGQDRGVLDAGGHHAVPARVGERAADEAEVVGLSASGGEHDAVGAPKAAAMDARAAASSRAAHCPAACTLEGLAPPASQMRSISARASGRSGAVAAASR